MTIIFSSSLRVDWLADWLAGYPSPSAYLELISKSGRSEIGTAVRKITDLKLFSAMNE